MCLREKPFEDSFKFIATNEKPFTHLAQKAFHRHRFHEFGMETVSESVRVPIERAHAMVRWNSGVILRANCSIKYREQYPNSNAERMGVNQIKLNGMERRHEYADDWNNAFVTSYRKWKKKLLFDRVFMMWKRHQNITLQMIMERFHYTTIWHLHMGVSSFFRVCADVGAFIEFDQKKKYRRIASIACIWKICESFSIFHVWTILISYIHHCTHTQTYTPNVMALNL